MQKFSKNDQVAHKDNPSLAMIVTDVDGEMVTCLYPGKNKSAVFPADELVKHGRPGPMTVSF